MEFSGFSALLKHSKMVFFVKPGLEDKIPGTSSHDGIQLSKHREEFSSGLRTPKWRTLGGSHLPLCFMDKCSIGFSLQENVRRGQLYLFRPVVLLEMFCGVQDILIHLPDTAQALQKILCSISLLQEGKSQLRLQQAHIAMWAIEFTPTLEWCELTPSPVGALIRFLLTVIGALDPYMWWTPVLQSWLTCLHKDS